MIIKRDANLKLNQLAKEYGVVSVTGPRQSGKTTLVKNHFPQHSYFNLEDPSILSIVMEDPKKFINSVQNGVIIDEVQKYPALLSYIQVAIDNNYKAGKYIITGSENLLLSNKISQSLAGRVGILELLPLAISELKKNNLLSKNYLELLLKGTYPRLYDKKQTVSLFYSNYLSTYIERDVRNVKNIGDLNTFSKFMRLLAGRVGQLLNLSDLGSIVGIDHKTAKAWLSVLEATYIIYQLEPYYKNFGKRLIKSPKIYFTDVGLATYLLGIDSTKELENHFALGSLFENMVISEFIKRKTNSISTATFYFVKDSQGYEIDLLVDFGSEIFPLEIKSSSTFQSNFLTNVNKFKDLSKSQNGGLIYTGDTMWKVKGNHVLNYQDLVKIKI